VTYPVSLRQLHHWDSVRPGERDRYPVKLLRPDELGPDDCYVPGGWCWRGATNVPFTADPPHLAWVDPFVIRRFPVTNQEYLAFLDDVRATRGEEEALRWVPRERSSSPGTPGPMCYGRTDDGRFCLVPDADGDLWDLEWPVMLVDWHSACAYGAWEAQRTGRPWRLPTAREWEKAGRGADLRAYPWGDTPEPAFACVRESFPSRPLPATVGAYAGDESPYGVRDLAGSLREWCVDEVGAGGQRAIRGGCWFFPVKAAHLAAAYEQEPHRRADVVGFRLVAPLQGTGVADT
jgi:serine/threonine-protein kinase